MDDDYGYDEGSDIDNWEDEQVFQDHEGEEDRRDRESDAELQAELDDLGAEFDADNAESLFRDEYEKVFGARPVFPLGWLTVPQLQARIENLKANAGRF